MLVVAMSIGVVLLSGCGRGAAREDHASAPIIADGVANVGREDGNLYAIDMVTRQERWRFRTKDRVLLSPT